MKKYFKMTCLLLVFALVGGLLAACGGGASAETTAATGATAETAAGTTTEPTAGTTAEPTTVPMAETTSEPMTEATTTEATTTEATTAETTEASVGGLTEWDYSAYLTAEFLGVLQLPDSTDDYCADLAMQLLALCTGDTKDNSAVLFSEYGGFEVVLQEHYDKDPTDASHSCAYTVGYKEVVYNGSTRPLYLVAVRYTDAGEWFANIDVAPSRNYEASVAENFSLAAEDIYDTLSDYLTDNEVSDPLFVLCGYSRGAACANLLAVKADDAFGSENVFAYTFATPMTVRTAYFENTYTNIFNIINPLDIVPCLPLAAWGFSRAGVDVVLSGDPEQAAALSALTESFLNLAPTLQDYYETRYSLQTSGTAADGLTIYELLGLTVRMTLGQLAPEDAATLLQLNTMSSESDLSFLTALISGGASGQLAQHYPQVYGPLILAQQ